MKRTLRIALPLLLVAAGGALAAPSTEPQPGASTRLTCGQAWDTARMNDSERRELMVELAHHAIQSQRIGAPITSVQGAVLGMVIEEACRQAPEASLRDTIDLAVRIAFDAGPGRTRTATAALD